MGITNNEYGESKYNPMLPGVVDELLEKGIAKEDEGAICYFASKKQNPLIVRKSDGGYGYATTDLAGCKYRFGTLKADRVVIITDLGQASHFEKIFKCAYEAGWAVKGKQ